MTECTCEFGVWGKVTFDDNCPYHGKNGSMVVSAAERRRNLPLHEYDVRVDVTATPEQTGGPVDAFRGRVLMLRVKVAVRAEIDDPNASAEALVKALEEGAAVARRVATTNGLGTYDGDANVENTAEVGGAPDWWIR